MRRALAVWLIALVVPACAGAAPISRTLLENGLTVLTVQSDHVQVGGIAVVVNASSAHEDEDLRGCRALIQQMISISSHSTVVEDMAPLSGVIRRNSSGLAVNTDWDFVEATYTVDVEELDAGLQLMADEVFEVDLTQEELEQARALTKRSWDASRQSPVQVTFELFRDALYGDGAMAQPQQGNPESLEQITLQSAQQFRDTHYVPANAWVCVVSPLPVAEATEAVQRAFGDLSARPAPETPPRVDPPDQSLVEVGESADLSQASLVVGVPLPSYSDPGFPAAEVIAALLEGPGGRIRRDLGLLQALGLSLPTRLLDEHYPISVLSIPPAHRPFLAIHGLSGPRAIERARVGLLRHLLALRTGSVTDEELERARARVINHHRRAQNTPESSARYLARRAMFGLGGADEAVAAVEELTAEDLTDLAKEYFGRHAIGVQMPGS